MREGPLGARVEIEGYEDLIEIGRGGFAVVFRATQPAFGRQVAVKVLTSPGLTGADLRRFEREVLAMGQLSGHPNIVVVYDTGVTATGYPYLVMEYLEGGSLGDQVRRQGALDPGSVMEHGVRLAGALHTAHDAGLLHRDVKPDNALVDAMGRVKLADFGIAALTDQTLTATGMVTATIAHAAPEVLNGQRATVASDVYSLGSTLFELAAGKAAFVREGEESIVPLVMRVTHEPVPDLGSFGVPEALATVIEAAMAKDPADRPATALALGEDLQAAQQAAGAAMTEVPVRHGTPRRPRPGVPASGQDAVAEIEGRVTAVDPLGAGLAGGDPTVREPGPARPPSGFAPPSPETMVGLAVGSPPRSLTRHRVVLAAAVVAAAAMAGLWFAQRDTAQPGETTASTSAVTTASTTTGGPTTADAPPGTTAVAETLSAGGLTEGTPEGLPDSYETLGFPMPVPSSVTDIDGDLVYLEFPPAASDEYDLEEFARTVPPQRGWTLDREDPPPGSTFGPTLHYSNPSGDQAAVSWGDVGPGPDSTRIEYMTVEISAGLALTGDGLGAVTFGDPTDEVLATLSDTFGPPDFDQTYQPGGCPTPVTRTVSWPDSAMVAYFAGDGSFVGYHFSGRGSAAYQLETPDGAALGDSLNDLTELYGPALDLTGQPFFAIEDGSNGTLEGFLSGEDPDDTVLGFMAGDDCSFD